MAVQRTWFPTVLFLLPCAYSQSANNTTDTVLGQCPTGARVNLTGEFLDETSGYIVKAGYVFSPESTWNEDADTFGCACYKRTTCTPLYCPVGSYVYRHEYPYCAEAPASADEAAPIIYSIDSPIENLVLNDSKVYTEHSYGRCLWMGKLVVVSESLQEDGIYTNGDGAIYLPGSNITAIYNFDSYCLCDGDDFYPYAPACLYASVINTVLRDYDNPDIGKGAEGTTVVSHVGIIVSVPFLLVTFIVYTILPELKNIHGFTLRGYVGCLLLAYTALAVIQITGPISRLPCLIFGFTIYFSFLASFLWLNAMSFDIWWTFGGFRSIRGKVIRHDRKKFIMYFVFAFGVACLFTVVSMAMNLVPGLPEHIIRPEFGVDSVCWFKTNRAKALYFYGPMAVTVICNIFFFVSTAVKIIRHGKETARHLKSTSSKRHDDNKRWFGLYLKLFIVMGINWSMEIASWLFTELDHIWYVTDLGNALQGVIIFVIFICKRKIIRSLINLFGFQSPSFLSGDSTRSGVSNSTSKTGVRSATESK